MKTLKLLAAIVGALVTIIGAAWAVDCHYAKMTDLAELSRAFQQHQIEQQIDQATDRLYSTEDRLKQKPGNEELLERKRELEERKRRLEQKLILIEKGGS
jgi:Skp family chaperone for outer membrane proteins